MALMPATKISYISQLGILSGFIIFIANRGRFSVVAEHLSQPFFSLTGKKNILIFFFRTKEILMSEVESSLLYLRSGLGAHEGVTVFRNPISLKIRGFTGFSHTEVSTKGMTGKMRVAISQLKPHPLWTCINIARIHTGLVL